jgi:hypothetical protein
MRQAANQLMPRSGIDLMSLLTPVIHRALRSSRATAVPNEDGMRDIGGTPLHQTSFQSPEFQVLHRVLGAAAKFYPRWVDKAAPGSA